jgi:hypothetical protein
MVDDNKRDIYGGVVFEIPTGKVIDGGRVVGFPRPPS